MHRIFLSFLLILATLQLAVAAVPATAKGGAGQATLVVHAEGSGTAHCTDLHAAVAESHCASPQPCAACGSCAACQQAVAGSSVLPMPTPTLRRVRAPDVTPYPSVDMAPGLKPPIR